MQVAPNAAYALRVSGSQAGSPAAFLPDTFVLSTSTGVTADATRDIVVTAATLQILARDDRDTPVPNVGILFAFNGSQNGFTESSSNISRTTGADGRAELRMVSGTTYTISATPPSGIGYVNTTFNGTSPISQDTETVIEFRTTFRWPLLASRPSAPPTRAPL
jgi:hypothetical protein